MEMQEPEIEKSNKSSQCHLWQYNLGALYVLVMAKNHWKNWDFEVTQKVPVLKMLKIYILVHNCSLILVFTFKNI